MSFYTSKVKTNLVDPQNDQANKRTEFRLDKGYPTLYLPNLRIANLGATSGDHAQYNNLTGTYGIIKKISLLDGNQVLDEVNNFGLLQGFRNYNKTNETNKDVSKNLNKNNLGFTLASNFERVSCLDITNANKDPSNNKINILSVRPPNFTLSSDPSLNNVLIEYTRINLNNGSITNHVDLRAIVGGSEIDDPSNNNYHVWEYEFSTPLGQSADANHSLISIRMSNYNGTFDTICNYYEPGKTNLTDDKTSKGWLDLVEVFPMLRNLSFLHTGLFKKLRVVLEYENMTSSTNTVLNNEVSSSSNRTVEPLLIADEVKDDKLSEEFLKNLKGFKYISYENDVDVLPVIDTSSDSVVEQVKTFRMRGFDKKRVERLLVVKQQTRAQRTKYLNMGSKAQVNEKYQIYVNNSELLPFNSAMRHNERLGMLHDVYGTCNTTPGMNLPDMELGTAIVADFENKKGELDYFAVNVANVVNDLQIKYQRTGLNASDGITDANNPYNCQLNFNLFAEVVKNFVVLNDGTYRISYSQ